MCAGFVLSVSWRRTYFRDHMSNAPHRIIEQVAEHTHLRFRVALARIGTMASLAMLSLFSSSPYYVFVKESPDAGVEEPLPSV